MPHHQHADQWRQTSIEFPDWRTAEHTAITRLRTQLAQAKADGLLSAWFFTRKAETWRLRWRPAHGHIEQASAFLDHTLDAASADGQPLRWLETSYEPEIHAFGGPEGMNAAHDLFCRDSRHILDHLHTSRATANSHRRELSVVLCSQLMRSAGQDWYEQGDIWTRVALERPTGHAEPSAQLNAVKPALRRLMTVDPAPASELFRQTPGWLDAFEQAGHRLGALAREGALTRGLRAVLAHHILFHCNRLGLPYQQQATLAATARDIVFNQPEPPRPPTTVHPVNTAAASDEAERLRSQLVHQLRGQGAIRTNHVETALRAVLRHLFLPGTTIEDAYADRPVVTKRDADGASLSSASQPGIVAMMLEQLRVEPGNRVLEIGAGTGYNAALLAQLTGPTGHITTIDIDPELTAQARKALHATGNSDINVITRDGALGAPEHAPYDRIIVTVGAWDIPPTWFEQLAPGGRLVAPLRWRGQTRSIALTHHDGALRSDSVHLCGFVPMIGQEGEHAAHVDSGCQVSLCWDEDQPVDIEALSGVLHQPKTTTWAEVTVKADEPFDGVWLRATSNEPSTCRISAQPAAVDTGLCTPAIPARSPALAENSSLAYLAIRPTEGSSGEQRRWELGATGHGAAGPQLADRLCHQIRGWDQDRTAQPVITVYLAGTPAQPSGPRSIRKRHSRLTVSY